MDMRQAIAKVVEDPIHGRSSGEIAESTADAVIAAIRENVPPLVWVRHPIGWNCEGFMIDARNPKAIYVMRGLYGKPRFDTVEEAKAAANTHHVAQVCKALGLGVE